MTDVLWVLAILCASGLPVAVVAGLERMRARYRTGPHHARFDTTDLHLAAARSEPGVFDWCRICRQVRYGARQPDGSHLCWDCRPSAQPATP